jgi:hypothetical protein
LYAITRIICKHFCLSNKVTRAIFVPDMWLSRQDGLWESRNGKMIMIMKGFFSLYWLSCVHTRPDEFGTVCQFHFFT